MSGRIVTIAGSWGSILVHAATGLVIAYDDEGNTPDPGDGPEWGYHHIARFDPTDIAREGGEGGDILAFGYWTKAGDYAEPLVPEYVPDPYSRRPGEMMLSEWVPLRLLPPPARRTYAVQPERVDNPGCHVGEAEADCFTVYDVTPGDAPSPGLVAAFPVRHDPGAPEWMGRIDAKGGAEAVAALLSLGGPMPSGTLPSRTRLNPALVEAFASEWIEAAAAMFTVGDAARMIGDAAAVSFGDVAGMVYSGLGDDDEESEDAEWRELSPEERRALVESQLRGEIIQLEFEAQQAADAHLKAIGFVEGFHVMELVDSSGWFVWATASDGGSDLTEFDFCLGLYPPGADCAEMAALMFCSEPEGGPPFLVALERILSRFRLEIGAAPAMEAACG